MTALAVVADTTVTQSSSSLILIAAIAGCCAVLAATIPIVANGRANRRMQAANWDREDKVAARVQALAKASAADSKERRIANEVAAEKLDRIIHQTDGLFTAALESEMQALVVSVASLKEVLALRAATDSRLDNARAVAVIEASEAKIAMLREALAARAAYRDEIRNASLLPSATQRPVEVTIVNEDPVDVAITEKPEGK